MIKLLSVARPQFLVGVLGLYLLGALWAILGGAQFSPLPLLAGYLVIAAAQLSVHFCNDVFDAATDEPGGGTLISGGSGVLVVHPELRGPALRVAMLMSVISLAFALALMRLRPYPVWMLGLAVLGNLAGWAYSAPPLRLASRGLGEPCYIFVGGFLVPAMGYAVLRGSLDKQAALILFPLVLYGLASMMAVQIPDVEVDRQGDKRTWVSLGGRKFGFAVTAVSLLGAAAYFFAVPFLSPDSAPIDMSTLGWLALFPAAIGIWAWLKGPEERRAATSLATWIVAGLSLFSLAVDGYLVYLILVR